ncbi:hypothetical protein [Streptomyces sp. NPDC058855]|uniref:hypothetical protein n=1 Tax=Streptomyces sp. NPDC058855 TaxID=3346651 RepID=UPI0036B84CD2
MTPRTTPYEEERRAATEERLRAALTARAALVTPHGLRPGMPPQGPEHGFRRRRAFAFAVLGAAAAVVAVCLWALLPADRPSLVPAPVRPAGPPAVTGPPPPRPATPIPLAPEPLPDTPAVRP